MNEVKRYEVKTIQFTTKQESDLYRELQSERAARIAAETKLAELEDVIAEIAYKKNNNEYGIMRRVIREDSKLFKAIENSKARSKSRRQF